MAQETKTMLASVAVILAGICISGTSFYDPYIIPGKHNLLGFPIPQLGLITYEIVGLLFVAQHFKTNLISLYNRVVLIMLITTSFLALKSYLDEGVCIYCTMIWLITADLFIITSCITIPKNQKQITP